MYGDISAKAAHMLGQPAVCLIDTKLLNPQEIQLTLIFHRYFFHSSLLSKCSIQVSDFFAKLIQRVSPKSYQQALAEVQVSQKFLENFCGDQVFEPLFAFFFVCSRDKISSFA
jgi:1-pyrroline-5-carboxylate dehydrogenase